MAEEQADVFVSCMLDEVSFVPSSLIINYSSYAVELENYAAACARVEACLPSHASTLRGAIKSSCNFVTLAGVLG